MILLTDPNGEIVGKYLTTEKAFTDCYAFVQLNPGSQIWTIDLKSSDKRIIEESGTEWLVLRVEGEKLEGWIRPIAQARSLMRQKHEGNRKLTVQFHMMKPVSIDALLKAIRFPVMQQMAIDKILRYPNIRLPDKQPKMKKTPKLAGGLE